MSTPTEDDRSARDEIGAVFDVSRETLDGLDAFHGLIRKWNPAINLVSRADLGRLWRRHSGDSLGLLPICRQMAARDAVWVDIGSGGGFPLAPLAIVAKTESLPFRFIAVESDQRKATFLRTVARELRVNLSVVNARFEAAALPKATVISARGLAELDRIFSLISRSGATPSWIALLKGARLDQELTSAARSWHMRYQRTVHPMGADGYILLAQGRFCDDKRSCHSR